MENITLESGHPVLDPQGHTIRLPRQAIIKLRQLGLLQKRRGLPQISETIYVLLDSEYVSLIDGLARVLGKDCTGPEWVLCDCDECRYR